MPLYTVGGSNVSAGTGIAVSNGVVSLAASNATATKMYLQQVSSGAPAFVQISIADCADYTTGTFTPVDVSGKVPALVFTATSGIYTKVGRVYYINATVTVPTNTDNSRFGVGGFPVGVVTSQRFYHGSKPLASVGTTYEVLPASNQAQLYNNATGGFVLNSDLSGLPTTVQNWYW